MTDRHVLEAIQKAVIAAVAACTVPSLSVRMTARTLKIPTSGKWLEVIIIPDDEDVTWGSEKLYKGLLRLLLHWPVDDKGAYEAMDLLHSIGSYFSKGSKHSDTGNNVEVMVSNNPRFMGVLEEAPEIIYPLSIQYRSYVTIN